MKRNNSHVTKILINTAERRRLLASAYRILLLAAKRKSHFQEASLKCVTGEVTQTPVASIEHNDQVEFTKGGENGLILR